MSTTNKAFTAPTSPKRIDGRDLRIFIATESGAAASSPIACAKSCSVDVQTIFDTTSDKDSAANGVNPLRTEFSASSSNLLATFEAYTELTKLQLGHKPLYMTFTQVQNASQSDVSEVEGDKWNPTQSLGLYGMVYIESVSMSAQNEGKAEMSIKLKGSGALKVLGD